LTGITRVSPLVSVIVTVHNTPVFIEEAIESLLGQTFCREDVEIVVVSDFSDPSLERSCSRRGIAFTVAPGSSFAQAIARGLEQAAGDVVAFLDQDDAYDPRRLALVMEVFDGDRAVSYYQNNVKFIDERGKGCHPTLTWGLPWPFRTTTFSGRLKRVHDGEKVRIDPQFGLLKPGFNTTSIAVRRDLVPSILSLLASLRSTVDSALFYAAWASPGGIVIDPRQLSKYRIHETNTSLHRDFGTTWLDDLKSILLWMQRSGCPEYRTRPLKRVILRSLLRAEATRTGSGRLTLVKKRMGEMWPLIEHSQLSWGPCTWALSMVGEALRPRGKPLGDGRQ
jgi:glycosyltransferase involved in cell wall biosynthesis